MSELVCAVQRRRFPVPKPDPSLRTKRVMLQGDVPSPFNPPTGCRFHTRCPHVRPRCSAEEPKLREAAPGHRLACHFFERLPAPTIVARAGAASGKFAERLGCLRSGQADAGVCLTVTRRVPRCLSQTWSTVSNTDRFVGGTRDGSCPSWVCAVQRRRFPVGANPTRQPLQPEAIGAVMEVTKWLKPSISVSRIGDSAMCAGRNASECCATTPAQRLGVLLRSLHPDVSVFPIGLSATAHVLRDCSAFTRVAACTLALSPIRDR